MRQECYIGCILLNQNTRRVRLERQRRAIRVVLSSSLELRRKLLPYLIIKDSVLLAIEFDLCLKQENLTPSMQAAIFWLAAIWSGHDLIKKSREMDPKMRASVLKALRALWE